MLKQTKIDGVQIAYREEGEGAPLILVHGLGACQELWNKNIEPLSQFYRVITLDLPGCGRSGKPFFFDYSILNLARILEKFVLLFADRGKVALAGNSLGGGLALMAAARLKEKLAHLIVMGSVCYPQQIPPGFKIGRMPVVGELSMLFFGKWAVRFVMRESLWDQSLVTEEWVNCFARPIRSFFWRMAQLKTVRGIVPRNVPAAVALYRKIETPTLIIWGREDYITPLQMSQQLQRDISKSQLQLIPQCGHIPQFEKPELVNKLILDFLKT